MHHGVVVGDHAPELLQLLDEPHLRVRREEGGEDAPGLFLFVDRGEVWLAVGRGREKNVVGGAAFAGLSAYLALA